MILSGKLESLNNTIKSIERRFGKGSIMQLGSDPILDVHSVSSGSLGVDIALGIGGYPRGRFTEIYGPESSGKTTLALHAIAEVQKQGGTAAFIDAEHALDVRSEEHTSELQSRGHLVCRLLPEKKKLIYHI